MKGVWLKLYENSLAIFFLVLFLLSLLGHANGGASEFNAELREHGQPAGYNTWSYHPDRV